MINEEKVMISNSINIGAMIAILLTKTEELRGIILLGRVCM